MGDLAALALPAVLAFLLAGTIKGTVGIGLPTASVGILSQIVSPHEAIALVCLPMVVANAWQVWRMGDVMGALRRYALFGAVLVAVLWFTTSLTAAVSERALVGGIGAVVVLFSLFNLFFVPIAIPPRRDRAAQAGFGALAGVLGGLTGIWAAPLVAYLLGRGVDKDEFVRATGLLIFLGALPLAAGFWWEGLLTPPLALLSAAMILPTLAGFALGEALRARLPAERFRKVVLLVFLGMGLNLLRRALI